MALFGGKNEAYILDMGKNTKKKRKKKIVEDIGEEYYVWPTEQEPGT